MRFTKMHGCGNDYVFVDLWREALPDDPAALARAISDRHLGVGADGLIAIGPHDTAEAAMRMWNADGSESEMCGNGLRCAVVLAWDHGHLPRRQVRVHTGAGLLQVEPLTDLTAGARISMGAPRLEAAAIPVHHPGPGPLLSLERTSPTGEPLRLIAVGMGNPHAVVFVADAEAIALASLGPLLEHDPAFPRRCNVEFVSPLPAHKGLPRWRQRTWERGSGETLACGTGACAVAVAAVLSGRCPPGRQELQLDGGLLQVDWDGSNAVALSGPATTVFHGIWPG